MHSGNADIYEVLLRLPGEGNTLILPSAFLPVAQRPGMMVDVDYWMICNALKVLAHHRRSNPSIKFATNP